MCGISGIIGLNKNSADRQGLKLITDAIRHRGPDGDGYVFYRDNAFSTAWGDDTPETVRHSKTAFAPARHINEVENSYRFAFGHRRLAILDLGENGHQPLCDPQQQVWITYNGEIYNYIELRQKLENKGHQFLTRTDTEVIVAAYKEWGPDCVKEFNGMWAFVLFDNKTKSFFGSRDRFGVKPLYYYSDGDQFIFASEQKAILRHPAVQSGINPLALADYFIAGEIDYRAQGLFQNILELFPSSSFSLSLDTGIFNTWVYYTLKTNEDFEPFDDIKFAQYSKQTEELLREAVRIRLRSDVALGSCLSGGIDSSAIVGIMHNLSQGGAGKPAEPLNTFTASFKEKEFDESAWAKLAAERAGAQWHQTYPSREGLMEDLEQMVYCQDSPIWSTSTYAQYKVMQLARQKGVKVILDGQGGDELFAGYNTYYTWYLADLAKHLQFGKASKTIRSAAFPGNFRSVAKDYLKLKTLYRLSPSMQLKITKAYFKDISFLNPALGDLYLAEQTANPVKPPHSLNGILHKEFVNTRLKGYLKCEDRCSMWHSVESRTPFADDHPLIEFVFSVPGSYKIHQGKSKYLLRDAVKNYLPPEILGRTDKMGYATPNNKWIAEMKEELRPYFTDTLSPYIQMDKFRAEYDSFFNIQHAPENGRIFKFMVFAIWMKVFNLK